MRAILLVHYGASRPEARAALDGIAQEAAARCPGWTVFSAWTGRALLRRARAAGMPALNLSEALTGLAAAGFDEVAVQPTFLHRGAECTSFFRELASFRPAFRRMAAGRLLFDCEKDCAAFCRFLVRRFPCAEGEALVLAGHAVENSGVYDRVNAFCPQNGQLRVLAGALPDFNRVLMRLRQFKTERVLLLPFLLTPGVHALRDVCGEEAGSWRFRLAAEGYEVQTVPVGLAELPEFRAQIAALTQETARRLETAPP